jgi:ribose transport system substrate-binding protein
MKSFSTLLFLTLGSIVSLRGARAADGGNNLSFGLLNGATDFFTPIKEGWDQKCKDLDVTCYYRVPNGTDECAVAIDVREMIELGVNGIALKPCTTDLDAMRALIDEAAAAGVPVVTFDSDVPNSTRAAYVGTDQVFMGRTMATLLRQLRPDGGRYAIVGPKEGRLDGFTEEIMKYNNRDDRAHWFEVQRNFSLEGLEYMEQMENYALLNPTAMITMIQTPMRHPNWTDFVDAHRHQGITYIGTDGSYYQLEYLNRRYVDGLVGQLPYEMGTESLQVRTLERTVLIVS